MAIEYKTPVKISISGAIPSSTTLFGHEVVMTHTGGAILRLQGINVALSHNGSGTVTLGQTLVSTVVVSSSQTLSNYNGTNIIIQNAGTLSNFNGHLVQYTNTAATTTATLVGYELDVYNTGGAVITSLIGYQASLVSNASSTVTTIKGFNLSGWTAGGTVTNSYGIYADASIDRGATLKYFIYSLSTSQSFFSGNMVIQQNSLGATSTDGLLFQNTTAATVGAQKWPGRIHWSGQGWKTNATAGSQTVDFIEEMRPVQGAANPSVMMSWASQINAGGYTDRMVLTSDGWMGLNTAAPEINLHLVGTIDPTGLIFDAIGAVAANFIGRRANGTVGSKTAVASDDNLLVLGAQGYGASAYSSASRAVIRMRSSEGWTNTAQGAYIRFETTLIGGTTVSERMRITDAGNLGFGTTAPGVFADFVKSSNSGTVTDYPIIRAYNSLATLGDGSSTFNRAQFRMEAGNGTVQSGMLTTYETGGSTPTGLYFRTATNHSLYFMTNNTVRVTVLNTGQMSFRHKPRIPGLVASTATVTFDLTNDDTAGCTALATNVTVAAPSGTPDSEQRGQFYFKDNGTARTITWNSAFRWIGITAITTTVISKVLRIGWIYNSADSKYDIVSAALEA